MTEQSSDSGKLQIGDQWNAISIIAHSQTHPLKAVCELTENAIDAGSSMVHLIRRRIGGATYLEIQDDGGGVRVDDDGLPNFEYIATHICDSMKRYLRGDDKSGVHGEFGIGLLSFWSLGEELRMASAGKDGKVYELTLRRGDDGYQVRPMRGTLATGGTRVLVGPLLPTTRAILTGEKLDRYLSAELRDRIRDTGVSVKISDRVARREIDVKPREFVGELLDLPAEIETPAGKMLVELYMRPGGGSRDAEIALCKDGTRVLPDITHLPQFSGTPWTDDRLEGIIDYPALNLAPGTRGGVIPDEKLDWFVEAMSTLEAKILEAVESREQAASERASKEILRQVQKAFVTAIQRLPRNEYFFFDIPRKVAKTDGKGGGETIEASVAKVLDEQAVGTLAIGSGTLTNVVVRPPKSVRKTGEAATLTAVALDEDGLRIETGISYGWRVLEGDATCEPADTRCTLNAEKEGRVQVQVTAHQKGQAITEEVEVLFSDTEEAGKPKKGLPSYRLESEPGNRFRSRYDAGKNEITINSGHRDFLTSLSSGARHRRYVGKLYAKEVVLINFSHETPSEISERMIEMIVRTEEAL